MHVDINRINFSCKTNDVNKPNFIFKDSGDNVFLHFWATWCGPCKRELPELQKIYNEYNKDIDFIFISCDNSKLDIDTFLFNNKLTIPVGYDLKSQLSAQFNVRSIPMSFLINKKNSNIEVLIGARDYDQLKQEVSTNYSI